MAQTSPIKLDVDIGMASETDVAANAIATKLNLGLMPSLPAVIEAEQQNAIASIPRLPAPSVQGASQPKTSPITGAVVDGSLTLPPEAAAALARSKEITGLISNQLQTNLGASQSNADAMADAITERIGADQIITLQTDTENMKAQNQLINVVEESTSEENQARLMDQLHEQAQDIQGLLEEREQEAAEGGFDFLIRSALNKEIYGTPGGAKDIEINSQLKQYQSTLAEIQGVTAATESFQTQNAATRELITKGTISANQRKIASTGQVELYKVTLEQNRSNAETLRTMLSVSNQEMGNIMKGYEIAGSLEGRQIQRERHALDLQRFERQKVVDEIAAKRSIIALQRETLAGQVEAGTADAKVKSQLIALDQAEINLDRSIIALTIDDATQDDKLAASIIARAQAETNLDASLLAFEQAENAAVDPEKLALLQLQLEADKVIAARTILEAEEFEDSAALRLASKEGALESQELNNKSLRRNERINALLEEGKVAEAQALLAQAVADRADTSIVEANNAATVQAYQSFIFGSHAVETSAVINSQLDNNNGLYVLMRQLGSARGPNGEFILGTTPAKADANLTLMEQHGVVSNEITGVRMLREVRNILQKKHAADPLFVPKDEVTRAIEFNAATAEYQLEQASEIVFGDTTNPLQPPTIPQMVELSPTLAAQPLFADVLTPAGNVDTNMDTVLSKALQAMQTGIISEEEAVEGIVSMGNTIGLNNNINHHGMVTVGLPYISNVNMRVMKPRGFTATVFSSLASTIIEPSNFITLDITNPVAVRQHLISILSSTSIGVEGTKTFLEPEEKDEDK